MNWVIKAIYPAGGHIVMFGDRPMRFDNKQDAIDRAEVLKAAIRKSGDINTSYIVVEENM